MVNEPVDKIDGDDLRESYSATETLGAGLADTIESLQQLTPKPISFASPRIGAVSKLSSNITGLKFPTTELASLNLGASIAPLIGNLDQITKAVDGSFSSTIENLLNGYYRQFSDLADSLRKMGDSQFPPNWRGEEAVGLPQNLEAMLLDEGLPLAWVPSKPVLEKLFTASTAGKRRKILSDNWRDSTNRCLEELESVDNGDLHEYVEFAVEAGECLLDQRWRASQALSANLLDSILHQSFDKTWRKELTGQKARIDWEDYPVRSALVFGGIWGSYSEYWASQGDQIPRRYTRNATVHGVSRHQYTRLNSVIALMHVVGLIKLLESDLA